MWKHLPTLKVLYIPLPCMHRHCGAACQQEVHEFLVYECPMYERKDPRKRGMTEAQPNFVFSPEIRTEEHPSKWILRGVALLNYFGE